MLQPLSDVFASTPNGSAQLNRARSPKLLDLGVKIPASLASKAASQQPAKASQSTQDSGYYGSQDIDSTTPYTDLDYADSQTPASEIRTAATAVPVKYNPAKAGFGESPEKTFQTAKEDQSTRNVVQELHGKDTPFVQTEARDEPDSSPAVDIPTTSSQPRQYEVDFTQNTAIDSLRSPSDGSSPIRPVVRKSSINFASLPAREPLAAGKSIGGRVSRTSHLDLNRNAYYRTTSGKSLGNLTKPDDSDEDEEDEDKMDVDEDENTKPSQKADDATVSHAKTYTQRLQDQINKLGKSQIPSVPESKSVPNTRSAQKSAIPKSNTAPGAVATTPSREDSIQQALQTTPGAFPQDDDDDDDDWIEPPSAVLEKEPRPALPKSYSADVMEGIHNKDTIGQPEFPVQKNRAGNSFEQPESTREAPGMLEHLATDSSAKGVTENINSPTKPSAAALLAETRSLQAPPESPSSKLFKDSPLRQVKNKLSSILKSSRGLLASSAAISAEGRSLMSPSVTRLGLHAAPSSDSIATLSRLGSQISQSQAPPSPTRSIPRPITASSEFDKEEKRRVKEEKMMADQLTKLDKAREQEREKARVFSKEQERIAAMEGELASKKQAEAKKALPLPREVSKPVRSSPRRAKASEEDGQASTDKDTEMVDAPAPKPTTPGHSLRNREVKRPVKPGKDPLPKAKQAPTVIRVNTTSQTSQYHPSSRQSTNPQQDNSAASGSQPHQQLANKPSKAALQTKASTQSLKPAPSSRTKANEAAAKKKEQEEREAQRRREAKAEADRKRAALAEEQRRQEQQRRADAEKQKQKEREQADEKKNAQRQAAIERAKQTKAPPPAARSQPNGPPDFAMHQGKAARADQQPGRPPSRMGPAPGMMKAGNKRVMPADLTDDGRPVSRAGPAYQVKDTKRRRTSENFEEEPETASQHIKGPPVRPSAGFKKELPAKAMFQNGYSVAPHGAARDLFKATVATHHGGQAKPAHPLDMAQISKGAIPFAPNPNAPSSAYKTPARPGQFHGAKSAVKSTAKSSPQFQNGESIELPEIQTDDEDDEDDAQAMAHAAWVNSPDLRRALMRQETMDPSQIFGPPAQLNMEEVFHRSKERWHTFRARTSSANWSGTDRLTEDDIRKDMVAREKLRREGGWSYEMSKDL